MNMDSLQPGHEWSHFWSSQSHGDLPYWRQSCSMDNDPQKNLSAEMIQMAGFAGLMLRVQLPYSKTGRTRA